jgi:hypothetical protein
MIVSFSEYLPWQVMHFLQRSTHFSRTCCRPPFAASFSRIVEQLQFCVRLGKSGSEPIQLIRQAYGGDAMRRAAVEALWRWTNERERSKPPVPLSSWSLRLTVCSTFLRSGWSVVRSAWLAKGGTSKKRSSPHLHKVPTRSNKVSPRTFQTALVLNGLRWYWN